jgi:hypothetical protein
MAVTDLTGTKWAVPADWSASAGYGMYSVTGTLTYTWLSGTVNNIKITDDYSDGHNLYIGYKFEGSGSFTPTADTLYVWEQRANGFSPYKPSNGGTFILEITGGADATNATLIAWTEANATQIIEVLPTTITYNGNTLAELEEGQTAVFPQDVKAKTNVAIAFGSKGSITYNGVTTEIEKGKTATLLCAGKKFATDVVVAVETAEVVVPTIKAGDYVINNPVDFSSATITQDLIFTAYEPWKGTYVAFEKISVYTDAISYYYPNSPVNGWYSVYASGKFNYGESRIITIPTDQEVSAEFLEWFIDNTTAKINDLTNTAWTINKSFKAAKGYFSGNLLGNFDTYTFYGSGNNFMLGYGYSGNLSYTENSLVIVYGTSGSYKAYANTSVHSLTITGGNAATNSKLITWLYANATKQ